MPASFADRKRKIVAQLATDEDTYTDQSPKGTVDEQIRPLISEINGIDGLVTTSSCSGRISLFVKGKGLELATPPSDQNTSASIGSKGLGGSWLFVTHEPLLLPDVRSGRYLHSLFGFDPQQNAPDTSVVPSSARFIHLQFEPMILHILTASLSHAQKVLTAALTSGFRESGAINIASASQDLTNPMVAVRSSGLAFDCIIGFLGSERAPKSLVTEAHLQTLVGIANDRFQMNSQRTQRFLESIKSQDWRQNDEQDVQGKNSHAQSGQRKERKRAEGLRKQKEVKDQKRLVACPTPAVDDNINLDWILA